MISRKYIMGKVDEEAFRALMILISASMCILVVECICIFVLTNGVSKEMKLRETLISHLDARRKAEISSNCKSLFLANMRCSTALLWLLNNILDLSKTPLQTPMQIPIHWMAHTPLCGVIQSPIPGSAQTPLLGSNSSSLYNMLRTGIPITSNEYPSANNNLGTHEIQTPNGNSSAYMQQPSPWLNQRHPLDVNIAYVEGREDGERGVPHHQTTQDFFMMRKRKREDFPSQYRPDGYIPQQDGVGDALKDDLKAFQGNTQQVFINGGLLSRSPQLDGQTPDPYGDALSTPNMYDYQAVNEDYNIANTPMPSELQVATPAAVQIDTGGNSDDHDDESLNEDDDEDDLDDADQGEDLSAIHLVLAQFDKVTRTKNRWKCMLKNGIMHINNKDILFNKATGEFDF